MTTDISVNDLLVVSLSVQVHRSGMGFSVTTTANNMLC